MAELSSGTPPAATQSIHREFLERSSPAWLTGATSSRRAQLKAAPGALADWYVQATPAQRQTLHDTFNASLTAQTVLDKAMAPVQDIDTFAASRLVAALSEQFKVQLDVHKTLVVLRKPLEIGVFGTTIGSFEVLRVPLLQAALHNFETKECEPGTFHETSGFFTQTVTGDGIEAVSTALTVTQFTGLCRSLDIGAQYQRYLKDYLLPKDGGVEQGLRQNFISARKADLKAAAEVALLKKDIEPADYRMILQVADGETHPWIGNKQVWFRDLGLVKKRMTGCVAFVIVEKYRYADELILYIPHDPYHPLKRFTWPQMQAMFKQRFSTRDQPDPGDGSPTAYQRFFSQFVAYGDLPAYFNALTEDAPASNVSAALAPYEALLNELSKGINPFMAFTGIRELPPVPPAPKVPDPDPYLNPIARLFKGRGLWDENLNLWDYLYEHHRDKMLADARSHAVPTADVDARVRSEKIAALLNIGLLVLNAVSMFVPVLGEVMIAVMAGQLLYETFAGSVEWAEGDRRAAKAHLVDVAENLAAVAVMAGLGKGYSKLTAVKPEPIIERLDPVNLPNKQTRLWKADLKGYESTVTLPATAVPNAQGQYLHGGKTYIRQAGKVFESAYDDGLKRWRIRHPTDPEAYQPPLSHNGSGAWRHTLERPQDWDRLTLMRRMGPVTDSFSDEQLLQIADISGTHDATLRKMHLDNAQPPAALADSLRLFKADQDVEEVIEQVSTGQAVDARYLYSLPLLTEMPRWPTGRVLEVFDQTNLSGASLRYGTERLYHGVKLKAPIRISRTDVLSSQLPAHILAALDESEIVAMLGEEGAGVVAGRPQALRTQLANYARTRQPALFDSLYKGTEVTDPSVAKLQRMYPGLSEPGAQSVLANADADQLQHLHSTGRVPLAMQELARWQVREGRIGRAFAGLHMDNLTSADSKRLALRTLSHLPGWSDQLRLEVREGSISGSLLDAIGSDSATQRKYLVKRGPMYQAFDGHGDVLNSPARQGDNFYASLMHVMPDETRQALGGQSLELRRAIIDYAREHRVESAQWVAPPSPRQAWFKPPQRISAKLIGYPASDRGEGVSGPLLSRVTSVYPNLHEGQANGFLLRLMLDNESDMQITGLLENLQHEWNALEETLTAWMNTPSPDPLVRLYPYLDSRPGMAQALRACWRNAPLAELPGYARLNLIGEVPLPPLSANFSHVRTLSLRGRGLIEGHVEQVLGYFPQVQELSLAGADTSVSAVPQALDGLAKLTQLNIETSANLAEPQLARLEGMSRLNHLILHVAAWVVRPLDVSRLSALRSLVLSGEGVRDFPSGVFELPALQRLDLKHSGIGTVPDALFEPGRERLWSGLSVRWARFTPERFRAAYEYVQGQPGHVMDLGEMVRDYCTGQLNDGLGGARSLYTPIDEALASRFFQRWTTPQEQFAAIEVLSHDYAQLNTTLERWAASGAQRLEMSSRVTIASTLRRTWNEGLAQRYGVHIRSSLDLNGVWLGEFPQLPFADFEHVKYLHLENSRVPTPALGAFIRGFGGLHTLDVSGCGLTELSLEPGEWPQLADLNVRGNPLERLDVSNLSQLQSLILRGTGLAAWPRGAEQLSNLTLLDLRDTRITHLPPAALAIDRLLLDTRLGGTSFSPQGQADLAMARQRVEQTLGLEGGTLSRFEQQAVGERFTLEERGSSIARQLLPLDTADLVEAGLTRCLNSWLYQFEYSPRYSYTLSASTRKIAAQRILASWRSGLSAVAEGEARELDFHGLLLGNMPELPVSLGHIERLNLRGVSLTGEGSNGFLRAFPRLRTLVLSSNPLHVLPQAVADMAQLERLELSSIVFDDPEQMSSTLSHLRQLRWLDLSSCSLETFRLEHFEHLENLDLSDNELSNWPRVTLRMSSLRTLGLRGNQLDSIPAGALEGGHDTLLLGTDISENPGLPLSDLHRLQRYAERVGGEDALGLSRADVQQMINDIEYPQSSEAESGGESESESAESSPDLSDEVIVTEHTAPLNREPWLKNLPPDEQARYIELWDQLAQEPNNAAFFNLLSLLPQTREFEAARASLTARVWRVMEAAGSNEELRQTLFGMSSTHGTCTDGRILTFSGLEIKVLAFDTLHGIGSTDVARKGPALLKMSRNLFRLAQVEKLAAEDMRPNADEAEVRLQYLIGLKRRLDLQGVPEKMRYGTPISGALMERGAQTIEALERTDEFYEDLISRDYWVEYLEERYPEDFTALEQRNTQQREAVEDRFTGVSVSDPDYLASLVTQDLQLQADRTQTLIALSRRADQTLNPSASDPSQPGTSTGLPT